MGKYLSGSLDVGAELDEEPMGPVIDEDEEESSSFEEDFGDLIRKELGDDVPSDEPSETPQEIKIEPAKEAPIIEEKEELPEIVPVAKPEPKKEVPKAEPIKKVAPKKEVAKAKPVKKAEPKPKPAKKPATKKVAKPKKTKVKKVSKPVEKKAPVVAPTPTPEPIPQPASQPSRSPNTRIFMFLILLLIATGVVYAVGSIFSTDEGAFACAVGFVDDKEGASLAWSESNAVSKYWLGEAFQTNDVVESQEILHMLACEDTFLSTLSEPASYAACETPQVYLIVDEQSISDNVIATSDEFSVLSRLLAGEEVDGFELEYELDDVTAWKVN
jgi:hypothetical protein